MQSPIHAIAVRISSHSLSYPFSWSSLPSSCPAQGIEFSLWQSKAFHTVRNNVSGLWVSKLPNKYLSVLNVTSPVSSTSQAQQHSACISLSQSCGSCHISASQSSHCRSFEPNQELHDKLGDAMWVLCEKCIEIPVEEAKI